MAIASSTPRVLVLWKPLHYYTYSYINHSYQKIGLLLTEAEIKYLILKIRHLLYIILTVRILHRKLLRGPRQGTKTSQAGKENRLRRGGKKKMKKKPSIKAESVKKFRICTFRPNSLAVRAVRKKQAHMLRRSMAWLQVYRSTDVSLKCARAN